VRFDNAFDVQAPIGEVWATVLDVERVAPCVPGAEVLEQVSEDTYRVGIKIRIGPIVQQYRGEIEIVEQDESAHRAVMRARAREMRGQGRAEGRVELRLTEDGATTHGEMATELTLSGPAAAMGRGLIQDVSARIVDDFATNLAAMLASGPAAPTAEAPAIAPTLETAAPDAPTREFPALASARPVGPDTAPPPESDVTAAPPAGPASEAALGAPSAEEPAPPPPPTPSAAARVEPPPPPPPTPSAAAPVEPPPPPPPPPTPAAAAATGGPSARTGEPAAGAPTGGPSAGAAQPPPEPPPSEREAALPVLSIVGDVALRKLREPKVIGAIAAVAVVGLMLRRRRRH
jgi:carbon monoxide dehydrogenase subunit G